MKLDVITPIGPGHQDIANRAVGSVEMAKAVSMGPFDEIDVIAIDDTHGIHGRSKARNEGVKGSEADWVFFLDADDLMHPSAFNHFQDWGEGDAVWGTIVEYREGVLLERFQIPFIRSFEDLLKHDPYLTIQMGHFVKREIALKEPFNEDMNTGEDWEYYLRVWKKYRCIKITEPLMCNVRGQHSTGPKSANGKQWREVVEKMIGEA